MQAAIDPPNSAPVIYICPGTYNENLTITRSVTLIGAVSGDGTPETILNGGGIDRVVTADSGVNLELENMMITGGAVNEEDGAGIYFINSPEPNMLKMTNCVVTGNTATGSNDNGHGGGIYILDCALSMVSCSVLNNNAVAAGGGIYAMQGSVTLDSSTVEGNWTTGTPGHGGGIYSINGTVTVKASSFVRGNGETGTPPYVDVVTVRGGGIYNEFGTLTLESGSHVENNAAMDQGGGLFNDGTMEIKNGAIVSNNTPNDCISTNYVENCSPGDPTP